MNSCLLLFVLAAEAIGVPAPSEMASDEPSLDQVMDDLGAAVVQVKDALAKSTSTLCAVHKVVLPSSEPPSTVDGFADVFGPGTSTMAAFARALTVRGSEFTLKLLLGHGMEGDYEVALSDFLRKPDGKLVSLRGVNEPAARLAEVFMSTMERRTAELATRARRAVSESTS